MVANMTSKNGTRKAGRPIPDADKFKVEKETFDLVLGKLINAKPFPKAATKARKEARA